jgi:hypothetical protein
MEAALQRGETSIDLTYQMPPGAAGAARALGAMLDRGGRLLPPG